MFSNNCYSFEISKAFSKNCFNIENNNKYFLRSKSAYYKDWSNDAEFKNIFILNHDVLHYCCFYSNLNQINTALMSIR